MASKESAYIKPLAWLLLGFAMLPGCASGPRPAAPDSASRLPPPPPSPGWNSIGFSVEGRQLLVAESGSGPLRIYLIGGVHGDEIEGRSALEALKNAPIAAATIRILRDLNPDGTAAFRRVNARGYDLNRNWPATNYEAGSTGGTGPLSEPESRAVHQDLRAFKPDLVVVLHSTSIGPLVNYDGPAATLATVFAGAAQGVGPGWHVRPDMGYPTPGSLGTYLGVDQSIPILTVEFERGQDEASAAAALRRGLAAVIRAAGSR
jgi:protein MpaA